MEFLKKINSFDERVLKILLSFIILVFGFIFFGRFADRCGVEDDDYGVIYSSDVSSFDKLIKMFEFEDFLKVSLPSNFKGREQSFFSVYYRPLARVAFGIQRFFFGQDISKYYLVSILFLSLSSILIFLILLSLSSNYIVSFFGALFFLGHPVLFVWVSRISAQNYFISMFFLLLSLIFFFKDKLFFSVLLYAISLFLFEASVFLPLILSTLFFIKKILLKNLGYEIVGFKENQEKSFGFWLTLIFFLLIRFLYFSFDSDTKGLSQILLSIGGHLYATVATFIFEFLNITIPAGNFLIKFILMFSILLLFLFLFLKNKQKKVLIYLFFLFILASWPIFIKSYRSRYAFFALPFFVLLIFILFHSFFKKYKTLLSLLFLLLIVFNFVTFNRVLENTTTVKYRRYLGYRSLLNININKYKPICFIGIPSCFLTNLAQYLWLNDINCEVPVFVDGNSLITNSTIDTCLLIHSIKKGFLFCLLKSEINSDFLLDSLLSMGDFSHYQDENYMYVECIFDEKYLNGKMTFITWDYQKSEFKILNEKPL